MDMTIRKDKVPEEIEVVTSVQRRRKWAPEENYQMVEDTYQPGMSVSSVALKYGISPS